MRQRRGGASETSNHPFRSMFDLMVALVFLLAALLVAQREQFSRQMPRGKGEYTYDARPLDQELLLLHNVQRRAETTGKLVLLQRLGQLSRADPCYALSPKVTS